MILLRILNVTNRIKQRSKTESKTFNFHHFPNTKMIQSFPATFQNGIQKRLISIISRALKWSNRFKQRSKKTSKNVQFLSIYDSFANPKCNQSHQATFQNGIQKRSFSIIFRALKLSNRLKQRSKEASKNVQFLSISDFLRPINVTNRCKRHSKTASNIIQFISFSDHWNYPKTFNFRPFPNTKMIQSR